MRKEIIPIFSDITNDNIEREYTIYTKKEIIEYIKGCIYNNVNLERYVLDLHAPSCFKVSLESLDGLLEEEDEVFLFESKDYYEEDYGFDVAITLVLV